MSSLLVAWERSAGGCSGNGGFVDSGVGRAGELVEYRSLHFDGCFLVGVSRIRRGDVVGLERRCSCALLSRGRGA